MLTVIKESSAEDSSENIFLYFTFKLKLNFSKLTYVFLKTKKHKTMLVKNAKCESCIYNIQPFFYV